MVRKLKSIVRQSPFLYFGLFGWRKDVRRLRARKDSDLVVEAFPRSANTTSVYALLYAQGRDLKIGHHLHVPAHLKYAVSLGLPCLVVIRNPLDCVASRMVMEKGGNARALINDYIDFLKTVETLKEQLVIVSFDDVISNGVGFAVKLLNQKFGTCFRQPDGSAEEKAWVEQQVREWNMQKSGGDLDQLSIPSDAKKAKSLKMKSIIQSQAGDLLQRAESFYTRLIVKEKTK